MIQWLKDIIRNLNPQTISVKWDGEATEFFYIDDIVDYQGRTFIMCRNEKERVK